MIIDIRSSINGGPSALIRYVRTFTSLPKASITPTVTSSGSPTSHGSLQRMHYNEDFFRFTRGRFVRNEAHEMSERYVRFDVDELARLAAEAVGSKSCVGIEKYPDGMHNKSLLLTMDDGTQVVAKVPNPNAGRPHLTTASEVATMEFARSVLGTPVPKVYAWSSRAEVSKVGAEYVIMEKLPGIQLDRVWAGMEIGDRFILIKTIAQYQIDWMSVSFKKFGSLYYAQDLEGHAPSPLHFNRNGKTMTDTRFAVGPSTGRQFIDDGRVEVEFDRGPWDTLEQFQAAIGYREIASVKSVPRLPKSPITLCGPGTYQPTRKKKLKALQCYLAMMKYLLPTDPSITSSCLWHCDLHVENIFVNPENPTEVVGIIDWQSTELAPLFSQARQPYFLDYTGPPLRGLERPSLPEDLEQLDPEAQKQAEAMYLKRSLCALYRTFLHIQSPCLYRAIEFQETPSYDPILLARSLLVDGEATYLALVVELEKTWSELPGVRACGGAPFPFQFSDLEKAEIEVDVNAALRGMEAMRGIQESLGVLFPKRGIVRVEEYEEVQDALQQMKEQVIDIFASNEHERKVWEEEWPFGG